MAAMRAGACGAVLGHSSELSPPRRTNSPSTRWYALPRPKHGQQLRGPNRRPCRLAAATIAFSRVGLVVLTASWDVLHQEIGLRILGRDGPQRRTPNARRAGPPNGPTAVHHSGKPSLLCRALFWPAILSAALGEKTLVTAERLRTDALAAWRLQSPLQTARPRCLGHQGRRLSKWLCTSFPAKTTLRLWRPKPRYAAAWCLAPKP